MLMLDMCINNGSTKVGGELWALLAGTAHAGCRGVMDRRASVLDLQACRVWPRVFCLLIQELPCLAFKLGADSVWGTDSVWEPGDALLLMRSQHHQAEWLSSLKVRCRYVCGVPILPVKSNTRNSSAPNVEGDWKQQQPGSWGRPRRCPYSHRGCGDDHRYLDIVDEALKAFRLDILALGTYRGVDGGSHLRDRFRTMDNCDRVMTYLMIWIHRCLCLALDAMQNHDTQGDAKGMADGSGTSDSGKLSKDKLLWILKDASIDADKGGESINDWKRTLLLLREETDLSTISSDDLEDLGAYFLHLRNITVDRLVRRHLYKGDREGAPSKCWLQYARLVTASSSSSSRLVAEPMPVGCGTTNAPPPSPGDPRCLYSALGLTRSASEVEIKKAYRQQALRWHPDKNQDNIEEATERFQQIGKAYEILGDSQKRRRYDLEGTIEEEEAFEHQNMSDFMNLFAAAMSGGFMGPGMFFAGGGGVFGGPQFYEVDSEDDDDDDEDEVIFLDELLGGFGAHRSRRGRDAAEDFVTAMLLDELLRGGLHRRGRYDDDDDDEDWETVEDDEDEDEDDGPLLEALFLDHFAHPVTNRTTRGGAMKFKCGVCRCCGGGSEDEEPTSYTSSQCCGDDALSRGRLRIEVLVAIMNWTKPHTRIRLSALKPLVNEPPSLLHCSCQAPLDLQERPTMRMASIVMSRKITRIG
ncbi:hypothetical protein FOZ60_000085 [Perkinsus olseni]|uniref:J domain-containing protein n=1 Tax=Perkinsus olseni TaxID=32597 RepID=A0A7J6PQ77_PEROL|nr:hypothetical protein FOZ60_000085 [Perkinsus olseni]